MGPWGAAPRLHVAQVLRHVHLLQFVMDEVPDVPRQVIVPGEDNGGVYGVLLKDLLHKRLILKIPGKS